MSADPGSIAATYFTERGRIFPSLPDEPGTAVVKAALVEQRALAFADPETYAPAPRVGRYGWVQVPFGRVDAATVRELVQQAWGRTAPKRLVDTAAAKST